MKTLTVISIFAAIVLFSLSGSALSTREARGAVVKQGNVKEDLYAAGSSVDVLANVEGDVVVAGGQVNVEGTVKDSVLAAGGQVTVRGRVGDDVRAAGGNVTVSGNVGDDATVAGGRVLLAPTASVGGRAWLAGGNVEVAGKVAKQLRVAGSHIVVSGQVDGDAELYGETIEVQRGAVIRGNLTYYSPNEAQIAPDAKVGSVTRGVMPEQKRARGAMSGGARLVLYITLMVTGIVLYLIFPNASVRAARNINDSPWKSLGLGFAFFVATPILAIILCITFVGFWLGLALLALYLVSLLFGFLVGILHIGNWGLRWIGRATSAGHGWRVLSIVAALVALWIVRWIPVLGGLIAFVVLLFGLGALVLLVWRHYSMPQRRAAKGSA